MHRYFILSGFTVVGIIFFLFLMIQRKKGYDLVGILPIEKFYFIIGKIALFTPWALFIFKAISPDSGYIQVPAMLSWFAVFLFFIGAIILLSGIFQLNESLKAGLSRDQFNFKTGGIFRYSRNPLYFGSFLISMASCLYFPDLINISFTLYGMYIHFRIILSEEKFLYSKFPEQYARYKTNVRRFI